MLLVGEDWMFDETFETDGETLRGLDFDSRCKSSNQLDRAQTSPSFFLGGAAETPASPPFTFKISPVIQPAF